MGQTMGRVMSKNEGSEVSWFKGGFGEDAGEKSAVKAETGDLF